MRIECSIPNATKTHSEYVKLNAFPPQQRLHERPQYNGIRILTVLLLLRGNVYCAV